jgi:hypothetical protein
VLVPNGSIPPNSTLDLSNPHQDPLKWHYKGVVELVRTWEGHPEWENFTTLDLTNAHLADTSLGKSTVAVSVGGEDYIHGAQTLKDLFASSKCKITTLNMHGLQFTASPDDKEDFASVLADALSRSHTLKTVDVSNTSPSLDEPNSRKILQDRCLHITFKWR